MKKHVKRDLIGWGLLLLPYIIGIFWMATAQADHRVEMRFGPLETGEVWMVRWWADMETCRMVRETLLAQAVMIDDPKYYVTCTPEGS